MTASAATQRLLLTLAATAVAFAAADTYVVVLALPEMVGSVGVSTEELQRAAPIISGFLLGYVAMLPLIGRIADLHGRVPVLIVSLVVFAFGSLITAAAYDLPSMVTGRFLQGVGGGGLVPATLALVADLYPPDRRAVPLGVVSAVQEAGSVVGPFFGALVLAFSSWRTIFVVNLLVGLILAAAIAAARRADPSLEVRAERAFPVVEVRAQRASKPPRRSLPDLLGTLALLVAFIAAGLVFVRPPSLLQDITLGQIFIPYVGSGRWLTPVGVTAIAALVVFVVRCFTAKRPLVDLRTGMQSLRDADLLGATYLAVALGGIILAFATADPKIQLFADQGWWYLLGALAASIAFVWHLRRAEAPLIPRGALRARAAWGSIVVSFFMGAALIAAVVDIPLFARTTVYRESQLLAALVLVRFLIALPIGAVIGGYLTRRFGAAPVTAVGMALAAIGFLLMTRWDIDSLESATSTVPLMVCGLGFGLALPPINAAILASTDHAVHGLSSAMVVVSRMVGMLVGISALTAIGLRRYYNYLEDNPIPPARDVCEGKTRCAEFSNLIAGAGIPQEHAVFAGAAVCAVIAGVVAVFVFRGADTRSVDTAQLLHAAG